MSWSHYIKDKRIVFFFSVAVVVSLFLIDAFEEPFHQELWHKNPELRYKMLDDILENRRFIGQSKNDVVKTLGKPDKIQGSDNDIFIYQLGKAPSFMASEEAQLFLIIENDTVVKIAK